VYQVSILALALALCAATAHRSAAAVGDVVALVRASSVRPAPAAVRGATTQADARHLLAEPELSGRLSTLGYERVTALGAATDAAAAPSVRLVLFSPTRAGLDASSARLAARALVADGAAIAATADRALKLFATLPNDSDLALQWYIDGPGDIKLPEAWDLEHGSASVRIGILDTGVDTGHEDLASKIWTNPGEIPANGIDDDGNGYIDDVHGWDFGNSDNDPNPEPMFDDLGIDEAFHGTAVAGVAAAATDNLFGIAGAGWNSTIVPLKVSDALGHTTISTAAEGVLYAAAKHFEVLNMSLGTQEADSSETALFQNVIDQATAANVLCVAAAGNDNSSLPVVPGSLNNVLCVAATSPSTSRSSFSNFGTWIDVCAPGEQMWIPICRNYPLDETTVFIYEFLFGYDGNRPYMLADGTSFSTPLTSGVAALVRAHFPAATATQVLNHIVATGDDILFDLPIGKKVNAYRALITTLDAQPTGGAPGAGLSLGPARPTPFIGHAMLSYVLPRDMSVRLMIVDVTGRPVRGLVHEALAAGPHATQWDGLDDAGARAPAGIYFAVLEGAGMRSVTRLVRID
jgi:subtilisin family serine protease